jgi:zinc transporter ZupT
MAIVVSLLTVLSTALGGLFAVRHKGNLQRIMGFTAGVLLGVIAFDLLPELFDIVHNHGFSSTPAMVALVCGFLLFHILEKSLLLHHSHESQYGEHTHPQVGVLSALALSGHSFLDGVGIGLGFQVNSTVGIAVALAVIAHDFADGLNTVTLMLLHKNSVKQALKLLALDAIAPVLGVISTLFFTLPDKDLVLYLGFFAGFLLYIGASDILPQAHSKNSSRWTIALTVLGTVFIFVVMQVLNT